MDQGSIEDLFERNADMRLLEFRHNEPGKGAPPALKRTGPSFGAESIVSSTSQDIETEPMPRMRVAVGAAPSIGVIPGAVVGVAIDVFNDGNAPAPESKLLVSLPHESAYRPGTLRIDGREVQAPEALFAAGLPIARLPGATSSKVTFQLGVLPGISALYLQPRLQTNGVPVVGTAGISIKRGSGVTAATLEPPRPFYELEDDAVAEVTAQSAEDILPPVLHERTAPAQPEATAPAPTVAVAPAQSDAAASAPTADEPTHAAPVAVAVDVAATALEQPAEVPAPVAPKPPVKPRSRAKAAAPPAKPEASAPEPPPMLIDAPPVAKPALGAAAAPEERMTRYRTLGTSDIALLERLFAPDVPGVIAHYVMISSVACNEPATGADASGYDAFLRRDIELLGRALVHSRMGKAPQYRIVQDDLAELKLDWQIAPPPPFPAPRRLRRDLRRQEWTAIGGLIQPSERDATLRTRIALLALAGATLDGVDTRTAEECTTALAAYRSAVLAWLVPLCVASAGADAYVIPSPPAAVDVAGRRLVAVFKLAVVS
jgi:hypothetical protein